MNKQQADLDDISVSEFDNFKHAIFIKDIVSFDIKYKDHEIHNDISYEKYIDNLLDNNDKLFLILKNNKCIGYIRIIFGNNKIYSVYIKAFEILSIYHTNECCSHIINRFDELIKYTYQIPLTTIAIACNHKPAMRLLRNFLIPHYS